MPLASATPFVRQLAETFRPHIDAHRAQGASAYMRNLFPFLGIATPQRRACVRAAAMAVPPIELRAEVEALYQRKEREYHYAAWDVACMASMRRNLQTSDVQWLQEYVTRHAWWDTVDYIVPKVLGPILRRDRKALVRVTKAWIDDENFWLQRAAIIVQLGWKSETDVDLLFSHILNRATSKEFFVQKGSGWALREYSKTDPRAVRSFLDAHPELSALTRREGGKYC